MMRSNPKSRQKPKNKTHQQLKKKLHTPTLYPQSTLFSTSTHLHSTSPSQTPPSPLLLLKKQLKQIFHHHRPLIITPHYSPSTIYQYKPILATTHQQFKFKPLNHLFSRSNSFHSQDISRFNQIYYIPLKTISTSCFSTKTTQTTQTHEPSQLSAPILPILKINDTVSSISKATSIRKYIGQLQRHIGSLRKRRLQQPLNSTAKASVGSESVLYDETVQHFFAEINRAVHNIAIDPTPQLYDEAQFILESFPTSQHQFLQSEAYNSILQHNTTHILQTRIKQKKVLLDEDFFLFSTLLQAFSMFNDLSRAALLSLHLLHNITTPQLISIAPTLRDLSTALARDGQYQLALYFIHITHQHGIPHTKGVPLVLIAKQAQKHNDLATTNALLDILLTPLHHFRTKVQLDAEMEENDTMISNFLQSHTGNDEILDNSHRRFNFRSMVRTMIDTDDENDSDSDRDDMGDVDDFDESIDINNPSKIIHPNIAKKGSTTDISNLKSNFVELDDFFETFVEKQMKSKNHRLHARIKKKSHLTNSLSTTTLDTQGYIDDADENYDEQLSVAYLSTKTITTIDIVENSVPLPKKRGRPPKNKPKSITSSLPSSQTSQSRTELLLPYKMKHVQSILSSALSTYINSNLPHHGIQLLLLSAPLLNGRSPISLLSQHNFLSFTQPRPLFMLLDILTPYIPQHLHQFQVMELLSVANKAQHSVFASSIYNSRLFVSESNYLVNTTKSLLSQQPHHETGEITIMNINDTTLSTNLSTSTHLSIHNASHFLSNIPNPIKQSSNPSQLKNKNLEAVDQYDDNTTQTNQNSDEFTQFLTCRFRLNHLAPHFDQDTESILFTTPQLDPINENKNKLNEYQNSLQRASQRAYKRLFRLHTSTDVPNPVNNDLTQYTLFPGLDVNDILSQSTSALSVSSLLKSQNQQVQQDQPMYHSPQHFYMSRRLFHTTSKHFPPHYLHQHSTVLYPDALQHQYQLLHQDQTLNAMKYSFGTPEKIDFTTIPTFQPLSSSSDNQEQIDFQQTLSNLFYPPQNLFPIHSTEKGYERETFTNQMTKHIPVYISPFIKQLAANPDDLKQLYQFIKQYPCFSYHINCILSPTHIHQSLTHDFHPDVVKEQLKLHEIMVSTLMQSGHHNVGMKLWLTQLHSISSLSSVQPVVNIENLSNPRTIHLQNVQSISNPVIESFQQLQDSFSQFQTELSTQPAYWNLFPPLSQLPIDHSQHHSTVKKVFQGTFELHLKKNQNEELKAFLTSLFPSIFASHKHQFTPLQLSQSTFNPIPLRPTHDIYSSLQISTFFYNTLHKMLSALSSPTNPNKNPTMSLLVWNIFSKGPNAQLMFTTQLPLLSSSTFQPYLSKLQDIGIDSSTLSVSSTNSTPSTISLNIPQHIISFDPNDQPSSILFSSHIASTLSPIQLQHFRHYLTQSLSLFQHSIGQIILPVSSSYSNFDLEAMSVQESSHAINKANIIQSFFTMLSTQATFANKSSSESIALLAAIFHPHATILPMIYKSYRRLLSATQPLKLQHISNPSITPKNKLPVVLRTPIDTSNPSPLEHELVFSLISTQSQPFEPTTTQQSDLSYLKNQSRHKAVITNADMLINVNQLSNLKPILKKSFSFVTSPLALPSDITVPIPPIIPFTPKPLLHNNISLFQIAHIDTTPTLKQTTSDIAQDFEQDNDEEDFIPTSADPQKHRSLFDFSQKIQTFNQSNQYNQRSDRQAELKYKLYQLKQFNNSLKSTSIDPTQFSTALFQSFYELFTETTPSATPNQEQPPQLISPSKLKQFNLLINTMMSLLSSDTFIYPSSNHYTTSFQNDREGIIKGLQHFANYNITLHKSISSAISLHITTGHKLLSDPVTTRLLTHIALISGQLDFSQRLWNMHYFLSLDTRELWSSTHHTMQGAVKTNHTFQRQQILAKSFKKEVKEPQKRRKIVYADDPDADIETALHDTTDQSIHMNINMLQSQKTQTLKSTTTLDEWISLTTSSDNTTTTSPRIGTSEILQIYDNSPPNLPSLPSYSAINYYYSPSGLKTLLSEHTKQLLPFTKLHTPITTPDQLEYRLLGFLQNQLEKSEEMVSHLQDPKLSFLLKIPLVNGHIREHHRFISNRVPRWSSGKYEDEFLLELIQSEEMEQRVVTCLETLGILSPSHNRFRNRNRHYIDNLHSFQPQIKPRLSISFDGQTLAAHFTKQSKNILQSLCDQVQASSDPATVPSNLFVQLHQHMQNVHHLTQHQAPHNNNTSPKALQQPIIYPKLPENQPFDYHSMLSHEQKLFFTSESISLDTTFDYRYHFQQFINEFNPSTLLYSDTTSLYLLQPTQRAIIRTMNYLTTAIHSGFPQLASLYLLKSITQQQFRHFLGYEVLHKGHLSTYRNSIQKHPLFYLAQHSIALMSTTQPALAYQTYLMCEHFGLFQPFTDLSSLQFPSPALSSSQPLSSEQSKLFSKIKGCSPPLPRPEHQSTAPTKPNEPVSTPSLIQNTIFVRLLVQSLTGVPMFIDVNHLYPLPLPSEGMFKQKSPPHQQLQQAPQHIVDMDKQLLIHSIESMHPLAKQIESPFIERYLSEHPHLGTLGISYDTSRSYSVAPRQILAKPQHELDLSNILIDNSAPSTQYTIGSKYAGIRLSDLTPNAKKTIGYHYLLMLSSNPDCQTLFSHMQPHRWTESTTTTAAIANNFIIEDNMEKIQLKPVDNSDNIGFHQYDYTPTYIYSSPTTEHSPSSPHYLNDAHNPLIRKLSAGSGISFSQMFIPSHDQNNNQLSLPTVQLDTSNMYHTTQMFAIKSLYDRNLQHLVRIPTELQTVWETYQAKAILTSLTTSVSSQQVPFHSFFSIQKPFDIENIDPSKLDDIDHLVDLLYEFPLGTFSVPPNE